ncbi:E3 ubiquitin-protein [Vigna angularis]|uniref:E3 ubiquitin-protein n=1 Tax=Phaseolus angularis TaxID=3914 RepID=A0A8T0JGM4_PHAAN|nr:E3 ubiquitin-protein [Vigna angularis]
MNALETLVRELDGGGTHLEVLNLEPALSRPKSELTKTTPVGRRNPLRPDNTVITTDIALLGQELSILTNVVVSKLRAMLEVVVQEVVEARDLIFEIINLANELLPSLPQGTISLPIISNMFMKGSIIRKSPTGSSRKQEDSNGNIYGSSVNGPVRHKFLFVTGKLMYFSLAEMIQSLLSVTNISRFRPPHFSL